MGTHSLDKFDPYPSISLHGTGHCGRVSRRIIDTELTNIDASNWFSMSSILLVKARYTIKPNADICSVQNETVANTASHYESEKSAPQAPASISANFIKYQTIFDADMLAYMYKVVYKPNRTYTLDHGFLQDQESTRNPQYEVIYPFDDYYSVQNDDDILPVYIAIVRK
ncbi:hypothetical protein KI688_007822 [Linnemannia hyalina]|uniref:Uncharacterized protein n=1 Tax=Linnemannia hyalina TaxID=64524 RepID=A0A9P7XHK2_9FUNG|nr:hypothetical protein KI688_007822 [Linnemannia hyalina]